MSSGPYVYEKLAQLQDQDRNVSHAQGLSIVYWLHRISVPKSASQITLSDPFPLHHADGDTIAHVAVHCSV